MVNSKLTLSLFILSLLVQVAAVKASDTEEQIKANKKQCMSAVKLKDPSVSEGAAVDFCDYISTRVCALEGCDAEQDLKTFNLYLERYTSCRSIARQALPLEYHLNQFCINLSFKTYYPKDYSAEALSGCIAKLPLSTLERLESRFLIVDSICGQYAVSNTDKYIELFLLFVSAGNSEEEALYATGRYFYSEYHLDQNPVLTDTKSLKAYVACWNYSSVKIEELYNLFRSEYFSGTTLEDFYKSTKPTICTKAGVLSNPIAHSKIAVDCTIDVLSKNTVTHVENVSEVISACATDGNVMREPLQYGECISDLIKAHASGLLERYNFIAICKGPKIMNTVKRRAFIEGLDKSKKNLDEAFYNFNMTLNGYTEPKR
jgi:hypothetical protein